MEPSRFTSHPKEGVLRICIALKNPSPLPGLNPRPLGPVACTLTTTPPRRPSYVTVVLKYGRKKLLFPYLQGLNRGTRNKNDNSSSLIRSRNPQRNQSFSNLFGFSIISLLYMQSKVPYHQTTCCESLIQLIQLSLKHTMQAVDQGFSTGVPRNPRVTRDVARGSARDRD
jgi:hypothetical protein